MFLIPDVSPSSTTGDRERVPPAPGLWKATATSASPASPQPRSAWRRIYTTCAECSVPPRGQQHPCTESQKPTAPCQCYRRPAIQTLAFIPTPLSWQLSWSCWRSSWRGGGRGSPRPSCGERTGRRFSRKRCLTDSGPCCARWPGLYFTLERLVILGSLHLVPLPWLPAVVCAASYAIFAAVMATVASRHYDWLIPSQPARLVGACMFCLLPGLNEMAGNLCNLNWILFCWLALVALKDPSQPFSLTELGLTWTGDGVHGYGNPARPAVFVAAGNLTSTFAARASVQQKRAATRHRGAVRRRSAGGLRVGSAGPVADNVVPRGRQLVVRTDLARLTALTPWIGDRLTYQVSEGFPAGVYLAAKLAFAGFLIGWAWVRRHDPRAQAILLFLIGVSGWTVLVGVQPSLCTRIAAARTRRRTGLNRYSFIMSFAALLFWLVVLTPSPPSRSRPVAAACLMVFVVLNLTLPLYRFDIAAYGKDRAMDGIRCIAGTVDQDGMPSSRHRASISGRLAILLHLAHSGCRVPVSLPPPLTGRGPTAIVRGRRAWKRVHITLYPRHLDRKGEAMISTKARRRLFVFQISLVALLATPQLARGQLAGPFRERSPTVRKRSWRTPSSR